MTLPPRLAKKPKRSSRWRSQAHLSFVRSHACSFCGSTTSIEVAHVRMGSGAGLGQKPSDWRAVPLCGGLGASIEGLLGCHNRQHIIGEPKFWREYTLIHGQTVDQLIDAFCKASPKAREIREARNG